MLITATATLPETHRDEDSAQDVAFEIQYSLERETDAEFVEVGYVPGGERVGQLFVSFTWPGYLHQARATLADYRTEGETDAGVYLIRLTDLANG